MAARDNAPVPHTCPKIDEIISAIQYVKWDNTYWTEDRLVEIMEEIRKANDSLRKWGNEKHHECEDLKIKLSNK